MPGKFFLNMSRSDKNAKSQKLEAWISLHKIPKKRDFNPLEMGISKVEMNFYAYLTTYILVKLGIHEVLISLKLEMSQLHLFRN